MSSCHHAHALRTGTCRVDRILRDQIIYRNKCMHEHVPGKVYMHVSVSTYYSMQYGIISTAVVHSSRYTSTAAVGSLPVSTLQQPLSFFFFFFFDYHFYFPAQLVGGFTLSGLPDKPWSQVSSLLPPGTCLQFLSCIGFSIPTARRFSSNVANSRSRAFR